MHFVITGKSTLTESLVAPSGFIAHKFAGDVCITNTRGTIKSTGWSLYYKMTDEALKLSRVLEENVMGIWAHILI